MKFNKRREINFGKITFNTQNINVTLNVSEQRKQWNKQYGTEICHTKLLYLFIYSNKMLISSENSQNYFWRYCTAFPYIHNCIYPLCK